MTSEGMYSIVIGGSWNKVLVPLSVYTKTCCPLSFLCWRVFTARLQLRSCLVPLFVRCYLVVPSFVLCCSALAPEVHEGYLCSWSLEFALCWWLLASAGLGLGVGGPCSVFWGGTWVLYPFLAGHTLQCGEGAGGFMRVTLSPHLPLRFPGVTLLVTSPLPFHSSLLGFGGPC